MEALYLEQLYKLFQRRARLEDLIFFSLNLLQYMVDMGLGDIVNIDEWFGYFENSKNVYCLNTQQLIRMIIRKFDISEYVDENYIEGLIILSNERNLLIKCEHYLKETLDCNILLSMFNYLNNDLWKCILVQIKRTHEKLVSNKIYKIDFIDIVYSVDEIFLPIDHEKTNCNNSAEYISGLLHDEIEQFLCYNNLKSKVIEKGLNRKKQLFFIIRITS